MADNNPMPMVGLKNYRLRELHPNAAAAIRDLHTQQWQCGVETVCGCGRKFATWSTIKCSNCRINCDHLAISGYIIQSDGRCAPRAYCGWCGEKRPDPPRGSWIYEYCFKDNRQDRPPQPCERCGSGNGTQLHHWAPRAIFDDPDDWPTGWLCPECHTFWHNSMYAAKGYSLGDNRVSLPPNGGRP